MLSRRPASCQAQVRSQSRHNAGMALSRAPTAPEFTILPHVLRVLLLKKLRLLLLLTEATREACHKQRTLEETCNTSGTCAGRGAGAHVKCNARLRDMNVGVSATADRNIEVLVQDLPCFGAATAAIDVTLRSALARNGEAQPNAAEVDGAVLLKPELPKRLRTPSSSVGDVVWSSSE